MVVYLNTLLFYVAVGQLGLCQQQQVLSGQNEPPAEHPASGGGPASKSINYLATDAEFTGYLEDLMERFHVPGVSIGVVDRKEDFTRGWGYARLDPKEEANGDTLYYLASITKNLVSATLLHVIDSTSDTENPLTIDTKIHDLIPEDFVLQDDFATLHATVKDLLSHQLGYPRHDLSYGGEYFTAADTVRLLRHLPMTRELREKYQYLNIGYITAQHIIQTLTGKWIGDVHREAIFEPLGMNASTVNVTESLALESNMLAYGYAWDNVTETLVKQEWWSGLLTGAGGLITSVNDYTKYLRAMIHQGLPFSKELQKALVKPLAIADPIFEADYISDVFYAMGWDVFFYRGHRVVTHSGAVPGFTSVTAFLPDDDWAVILCNNGDMAGIPVLYGAFFRLLDNYLEIPLDGNRFDGVAHYAKQLEQAHADYLNATARFYPDVPDPILHLPLPLEFFAGTYFNAGYGNVTFAVCHDPDDDLPLAKGTAAVLHALVNKDFEVQYDLQHVSGLHFIGYANAPVRTPMIRGGMPAEFEIGPDKKVTRLGAVMEPLMGDEKIWFDKIV